MFVGVHGITFNQVTLTRIFICFFKDCVKKDSFPIQVHQITIHFCKGYHFMTDTITLYYCKK